MHYSTKTYGAEIGLSSCFRQHRAESHCRLLHGYAMSFGFKFGAHVLDERNWVVDFGGLKGLKGILENTFDHKTIIAADDPQIEWFIEAERRGILELVILPSVGCEMFAQYVYDVVETWLRDAGFSPRCRLISVEVKEHGANGASYEPLPS
jgi:6-pyruvoyltetrahydropterin/6-carboxytetrahydropterin synthase